MDGWQNRLWEDICEAYMAADLHLLSDDKCCRLLAWLSVFGGGCEQAVLDGRLYRNLRYAQKRLNILGGQTPNLELIPLLQEYIKSAQKREGVPLKEPPEWVLEIEKEYEIKIPR